MNHFKEWIKRWADAWNWFWFSPRDPTTLAVMRILVGLIVFYTHLVWTLELSTFLGHDGLLPSEYRRILFGNAFGWSHLDWFPASALMVVHVAGLIVVLMFTAGLLTRWTAVLTAALVISYANRGTGALFGLDQINAFLCMYLAIGNSGARLSIDALRRMKTNKATDSPDPGAPVESAAGQGRAVEDQTSRFSGDSFSGGSIRNNIAIRLIQVHMCVVYLFAAIGKLQGETWLSGEAIWRALASREYQTIDMTWLADHMWLVALLTLIALAWELAYPALIWPRLSRPLMIMLAVLVHLGIGLCMGMLTFGLIMIVGNLAFVESEVWRKWNVGFERAGMRSDS